MCANVTALSSTLKVFEAQGIELLHIDVMDGHFVPNLALGTDYVQNIRKATSIPLDIHLMVENPEDVLEFFTFEQGDYVSVHIESTADLPTLLAKIREKGAKPVVALKPATPFSVLESVLDDIDGVLVMLVEPGFAGQRMIPQTLQKLKELRVWLNGLGYGHIEIEVDGNVSFENIPLLADAGANIFVAGTSSVFHRSISLSEGVKKCRAMINGEEYIDDNFISKIESGKSSHCQCGKEHKCLSRVYIGSGEIARVAEAVGDYAAKKVYLVCDQNTYAVAGEAVIHLLKNAGIAVFEYIFHQDHVIPDEKNTGLALMSLPLDCDAVVGIGSGVINDICKIVSATAKLPYIIVATAPSMDGYASATSSMEKNGLKISIPSKTPDTIIGDLDILSNAPQRMLSSGIGDMLAKYVSICEWRIAHAVTGEYYCERVAALMRQALKRCIEGADRLLTRDKDAVKAVFEGLIISGIATEYAGVSRPASGVEHYISHIFDMRGVSLGQPVDTHGIQCAIATLVSVELYNKLITYVPDYARAKAFVEGFDYTVHSQSLAAFVGEGAKSMIALEEREKKYDPTSHPARFERINQNWGHILSIIQEELPTSEKLKQILKVINVPECFSQIGIDDSLLCPAFNFTKDIRDKYVLSRLVWDLGIPAEELFEKAFTP